MTTAKYYYESHITIDPVSDDLRSWAAAIAGEYKFKIAKLLMDKGVPSQLDTFMTGHGKDLGDITERTKKLGAVLLAEKFVVRRYKIEDTVLDSRVWDELGLL